MRTAAVSVVPAAAALVATLAHIGPGVSWLAPVRLRWAPGLSGLGRPGHVAVTFDDGPHPDGTPAVLDALDQLGWRATFFLLGKSVREMPGLTAQIAAAGHEIGVHGDEHRYLFTRTPRAAVTDLTRAVDSIQTAVGSPPQWYRPPYGVLTTGGMLAAHRAGLRTVLWSAWGRDWEPGATPDTVVTELTRGVLAGGTALLHDSDATSTPGSWRVTAAALPLLAEELGRRGVAAGPLSEHGVGHRPC